MTNITKPIGERNRLVSKEEAKAMLERIEVPNSALEQAFDLVQESDEEYEYQKHMVYDFHGVGLLRTEYEVLDDIAKKYFGKDAYSFFSNMDDYQKQVYLEIKDQHVTRLDMNSQALPEIPKEIVKFSKLEEVYLSNNFIKDYDILNEVISLEKIHLQYNQIHKINSLDDLNNLLSIYLKENPINWDNPHNRMARDRLLMRNVKIVESV